MPLRTASRTAAAGLALAFAAAAAAAGPAGRLDERSRALLQAETDLAGGRSAEALEALELLAATGHSVEVELDLVRAQMQIGQYRRAVAFAAHVAGEHADRPAVAVLYAWLLRIGGQGEVAGRVLAAAHELVPGDPLVAAALHASASPMSAPAGILLERPHRLAPFAAAAPGEPLPGGDSRVVSGGVLLGDGALALVPAAAMASAGRRLWVRNGLGETRAAEIVACGAAAGPSPVAVLRLRQPLSGALPSAAGDPYAGSPGFAFEYPFSASPEPGWPQLRQGFLGSVRGPAQERSLGIEVDGRQQGGAVLDAGGHLAGMVLAASGSRPLLWPASRWPRPDECNGVAVAPPSLGIAGDPVPRSGRRISAEEAYERGLRVTLQILTAP